MLTDKQAEPVLIREINFLVADVETTGMSAYNDRITEVGLVNVRGGRVTGRYEQLINPGVFIPNFITDLTGISNRMVFDKPSFSEALPGIRKFIDRLSGAVVLAGHNVSFDHRFLTASASRSGADVFPFRTLCTARLARRLSLNLRSRSLYSLSRHFKIDMKRRHRALDDADATAQILLTFLDMLRSDHGIESLDELLSFQYRRIYGTFKLPKNILKIKKDIGSIPEKPGVYFMRNRDDELIYVGKAKNLNDRVSSYFYHNTSHTGKIRMMLREVRKVEFETTGSELSALILESRLIKKHKPRYNSATKRYGRFPFIKIDVQNPYPRSVKTYEIKLDGAKYYGPFRSSATLNHILDHIGRNFMLRKCEKKLDPGRNVSPCMYYEIKQCKAPCNLTQSLADYRNEINKTIAFIESQASEGALESLEQRMFELSGELKYEEASVIRDRITDLKKVIRNFELTSGEPRTSNYIVKCRHGSSRGGSELFLVSGGRLYRNIKINPECPESDREQVTELINNIYFRGNLFNSVLYNGSGKFTREELDSMKIITNWVHLNNSPATLFRITPKTKPEEMVAFVYS